jgi:class 3 adenylate cyclase
MVSSNKKTFYFIGLFFFLFSFCKLQESSLLPKSSKGVIDLQEKTIFNSEITIPLNGEWFFYWNKFIQPSSIIPNNDSIYLTVPSQWQQANYPIYGYASYQLLVLLPDRKNLESLPKLGIFIPDAGSSYRLFINQYPVAKNGEVGTEKKTVSLFQRYSILNLSDLEFYSEIESTRKILITIHVSNYHYHNAGLWNSLLLGTYQNIERKFVQKIALDIILFSALFIMGLYHIGLYINRRRDSSPFYFGIFCILISIRTICIQERLIFDIFSNLPFWLVHKLEFITFYSATLVSLLFIKSLFIDEFIERIYLFLKWIFILLSLIVLLFPMEVYLYTLPFMQIILILEIIYIIFISILAIKNKRTGARLFFTGIILFGGSIIHDILVANGGLHTRFLTSYGLISLIIFQSTALSRKFSNAFYQSEILRHELKILSESLEMKVKERTDSLEIALKEIQKEKEKSEQLLLNILPKEIAEELKDKGYAEPCSFDSVTVMFTDFKDFTKIASHMTPKDLVRDLEFCFVQFDKIIEKFGIEKLKTIGDSYMCASGIPKTKNKKDMNKNRNAIDACNAALEIVDFMNLIKESKNRKGQEFWDIRIGIHSGPLVAGVIGEKKLAYDVWGDTVNVASRMESNSNPGKINISGETYQLVKDYFKCEYRGKMKAKNKGQIDMYFLTETIKKDKN